MGPGGTGPPGSWLDLPMWFPRGGAGGTGPPGSWLDLPKFSSTLDTLWSIDSLKNSKFDATRCQILRLKCTKFDFRWGSAGELTALPESP